MLAELLKMMVLKLDSGRAEVVLGPGLAAALGEAVGAMTVAELRPAEFQGTFAT